MLKPEDWIAGEPPRDGEFYLGWFQIKGAIPVKWSGWGGGAWDNQTGHHLSDSPLFWMPMPVDPTQEMITHAFSRLWNLDDSEGSDAV